MTTRERDKLLADSVQRVQRADKLMRSSERLMRATSRLVAWPHGGSTARQPRVLTDWRNREQEEQERLSRRRLIEAAKSVRSLAREACVEAQEARWRSVQTRTVSAALRARRWTTGCAGA